MLNSPRTRVRTAAADGSMRLVNAFLATAAGLCALAILVGSLSR